MADPEGEAAPARRPGILTAIANAHRPRWYDEEFASATPSLCSTCIHLVLLCLCLSLPSSLALLLRCSPALTALSWRAVASEAERVFPAGLELIFNNSTLQLRPDADASRDEDTEGTIICWSAGEAGWCATAPLLEPIRLVLPAVLHDAFYTDLPRPLPVPSSLPLAARARDRA